MLLLSELWFSLDDAPQWLQDFKHFESAAFLSKTQQNRAKQSIRVHYRAPKAHTSEEALS